MKHCFGNALSFCQRNLFKQHAPDMLNSSFLLQPNATSFLQPTQGIYQTTSNLHKTFAMLSYVRKLILSNYYMCQITLISIITLNWAASVHLMGRLCGKYGKRVWEGSRDMDRIIEEYATSDSVQVLTQVDGHGEGVPRMLKSYHKMYHNLCKAMIIIFSTVSP